MDTRVFVRPAEGLLIRDDITRTRIPAEGTEVLLTRFIARRIQAGELVVCEPPAEEAPKKSKKSTSEGTEG